MNRNPDNDALDASFTSLYPDMIPAENGHPTSDKFFVMDTGDERGMGIKGKVEFYKDECVARLSGVILKRNTLDTIQITPKLFFADRWFCRFLLHSCDPNLKITVESLEACALRDISPGEYLTIDYAETDDAVAFQFACNCRAPYCRRWITGRAEELSEEGRNYLARKNL